MESNRLIDSENNASDELPEPYNGRPPRIPLFERLGIPDKDVEKKQTLLKKVPLPVSFPERTNGLESHQRQAGAEFLGEHIIEKPALGADEVQPEVIARAVDLAPVEGVQSSKEVLRRVEAAAGMGVKLEGYLEQRHERKDGAGAHDDVGTVAVQGVVGSQAGGMQQISQVQSPLTENTKRMAAARSNSMRQQMYRQAIIGGLWGAVGVLFIILLILLFN